MLTLRDFMTRDVLALDPSHSLGEALELFTEHHITGAPVVENGVVLGVLSMSDLMDAAAAAVHGSGDVPEGWGETAEADDDVADVLATYFTHGWAADTGSAAEDHEWTSVLDSQTVGDVMTRTLAELPVNTEVHEAARYMLERGIHRVLVVDGGRLEGLVTTTDFLRLVAERKL